MAAFDTTLDLLVTSAGSTASSVLAVGLDETSPHIQRKVVQALLSRGSVSGITEIVKRAYELNPVALVLLHSAGHELDAALTQCIEQGGEQLQLNALRLANDVERLELLPRMIEYLLNPKYDVPLLVESIAEMSEALYDHWNQAVRRHRGNASKYDGLRVRCVTALDTLIGSRESASFIGAAIHLVLMLGEVEDAAVKRLLWRSSENLRTQAGEFLVVSRHPGVMNKVVQSLSTQYPHPRAFDAIRYRTDPEFISFLLSKFPRKLTTQKQANLRQVDTVTWLEPGWFELAMVPEELQPSLVRFVASTGIPREHKSHVYELVLREGTADGRNAAAEFDSVMDTKRRREIIDHGLESGDAGLQLWAITQLRKFDDPESFGKLIESLDSADPEMAAAARRELAGFDLAHVLPIVGKRNAATCLRAGQLLVKIHPETPEQLAADLQHPIRQKRIQGANAVRAFGLAPLLCNELVDLLEDPDAYVRQAAVLALGEVGTSEVLDAVTRAMQDPSRRVRDAATTVMEGKRNAGGNDTEDVEGVHGLTNLF